MILSFSLSYSLSLPPNWGGRLARHGGRKVRIRRGILTLTKLPSKGGKEILLIIKELSSKPKRFRKGPPNIRAGIITLVETTTTRNVFTCSTSQLQKEKEPFLRVLKGRRAKKEV